MITNEEIIKAVSTLLDGVMLDWTGEDIDETNFASIFLTKSPSQIEIDEEDKADYAVAISYADAYNEIMRWRRKEAYGTWEQQMEMQFDGTWEDHVNQVKADYPFI